MKLTDKQISIMDVIVKGNGIDAGGLVIPCDLDQLLERLPYRTTKASMHFSIRALAGHGVIAKTGTENRRGRRRILISPTSLGIEMTTPVIASRLTESITPAPDAEPLHSASIESLGEEVITDF